MGAVGFLMIISFMFLVWNIQSLRYSEKLAQLQIHYEEKLAEIDRATNRKLVEQQQKNSQLQSKLAAIEKTQYQELINEKAKNDQLIDDLATARKRLSITTTSCTTNSRGLPQASDASGLGNATATAYLYPRAAAALIRIARRGDEAVRQLAVCQNYFQEISK